MAPDTKKHAVDVDRRAESSPEASDSKSSSSRSKASIRVSLACVQCRSKHVKCDATQPACGRCMVEKKPCYYPKSRRGIRDPKKRSLISNEPPMASQHHVSAAEKRTSMTLAFDMPNRLPNGWTVPRSMGRNTDESLVNAFFDHFYFAHPILPPKNYLLQYAERDPNSFHFLLAIIDFCGALYAGHNQLNDLREAAYSAACGSLPYTVQSAQGLHLLAIIAFGEGEFLHHVGFANRSLAIAREIGMHRKSYADLIADPVWAESCRRTWWFIKFQGMIRRANEVEHTADIYDVESDVDIPFSEEWEYQAGAIPMPMTLSQYERDISLGRSDFPSLAFHIEMCRIQTEATLLYDEANREDEDNFDIVNEVDSKICDFLRRIPGWKMDVVDPDGRPDQVIFGAVAWAHISRIQLRQPAARRGLNIREYFDLGPFRGPDTKGQAVKSFGWNPYPVDIRAANSLCDMFRYSFPIKSLQPMMIPGLLRVAAVYLDACVYRGLDSPVFRGKISALIRILTIHGETWPLSKKLAEDIQAVVDVHLPIPGGRSSGDSDPWGVAVTNALGGSAIFGLSSSGFDSYSFLNPPLESELMHYHGSEHAVSSIVPTSLAQGLAPGGFGP
ncbi:hypothetical protein F4777DRAFT_589462 [Nemania sp. FL0916]|nr:hypothetical protein F4777DRAFT_589462 [Nemania sp. FL0916]